MKKLTQAELNRQVTDMLTGIAAGEPSPEQSRIPKVIDFLKKKYGRTPRLPSGDITAPPPTEESAVKSFAPKIEREKKNRYPFLKE